MNRWYFWVLAPVMLGSAAILVLIMPTPPALGGQILVYGVAAGLVLATLGLANPRTFAWALRLVAAGVLAVCLAYVVSELGEWRAGKPFMEGRRSSTSLFKALCALAVFGVPAVRLMLTGRSASAIDAILRDNSGQHHSEPALPDSALETYISADGMLKAVVFESAGKSLRVRVYVKQDDGPFGQPWIPISTSFADREALPGVLRASLHADYTDLRSREAQ